MDKTFYIFVLFQLSIVALAIIGYFVWDKRYRKKHGFDVPDGFEKTKEIMIDPTNGKKFRVYYNSTTGERFYLEENS